MMRTLWDWQQVTDSLKLDNKEPVYQGRNGSENSHYCHHCQVVFLHLNILFSFDLINFKGICFSK